jgi:hypothetical protein
MISSSVIIDRSSTVASFTFIASSLVNLLQNRAMEGIVSLLLVNIYSSHMGQKLIFLFNIKVLWGIHFDLFFVFVKCFFRFSDFIVNGN